MSGSEVEGVVRDTRIFHPEVRFFLVAYLNLARKAVDTS